MSADAKIKVGVDGVPEAVSALNRVKRSLDDAISSAPEKWKKLGDTIASSVSTSISDIARLANVANGISFVGSIEGARKAREEVTRMSVVTGQSLSEIQSRIDKLAVKHIISPERVAAATQSLRKLTGDAKFADAAFSGMADEAIATGKSVEELSPVAVVMHNILGVTGDTTQEFGRIRSAAEAFGNVTPTSVQDGLVAISGTLAELGVTSDSARGKVEALMSSLQGKSADPAAGARKFSKIVGTVMGNPLGLSRTLGISMDKLEEASHDPVQLAKLVSEKGKQRFGSGEKAKRAFVNTFGLEAGMSLFRTDFSKVEGAAGAVTGNPVASAAAAAFSGSAAGQSAQRQIQVAIDARKFAEPLIPKLDAIHSVLAKHPFLGAAGTSAAGGIASGLAGAGIKALFAGSSKGIGGAASWARGLLSGGAAAEGGGAAAAGSSAAGLGLAASAGLVAAAGAAGAGIGAGADWLTGKLTGRSISDRLAGVGGGRLQEEDEAEFQKDEERRRQARLSRQVAATTPSNSSEPAGNVSSPESLLPTMSGDQPIQITIVNQTPGPVDAMTPMKNATVARQ